MNISNFLFFFLSLFISFSGSCMFRFEGEVNSKFHNASAYLMLVEDLNRKNQFEIDQILDECEIDSSGYFSFVGDYLPEKNRVYKIYIDQCKNHISNSKHLLQYCDNHISQLFIANNSDRIFFPLNNMHQMFCSTQSKTSTNLYISQIDSVQSELLNSAYALKSKKQRTRLFFKYYKTLQDFGKQLHDPIAELYIAFLHAEKSAFTYNMFKDDIEENDYYFDLVERLKLEYPKSGYAQNLALELTQTSQKRTNYSFNSSFWILLVLFILSVVMNILFYKKIKTKNNIVQENIKPIDYKTALTKQEQNIFELMHKGYSNKDIAEELFISLSTVKTHINKIYNKLNIKSRKEIKPFFS
ncbi:MAG: helix-turn-helix domain-containing protein [Flavobacteriales bacterium]